MTEKITKLLEQSRAAFGMWRELDGLWQMRLIEALSKLMSNRALIATACDELQEVKNFLKGHIVTAVYGRQT